MRNVAGITDGMGIDVTERAPFSASSSVTASLAAGTGLPDAE